MLYVLLACRVTTTEKIPKETGSSLDDDTAFEHNETDSGVVYDSEVSVEPTDSGQVEDSGADSDEPTSSHCYDGEVQTVVYDNFSEFLTVLGTYIVVDFDDVDTSGVDPVAIDTDRYLDSHGLRIEGTEGQFVDEQFSWGDYISTSPPNMYAPGPAIIDAGGYETNVSFPLAMETGCVSGFGVRFIDADFPELGTSELHVYNHAQELLDATIGFSGPSSASIFQGVVTLSEDGVLVPAIATAYIKNGNVWPMSSCCEGVTLDDFVFSPPE